MAKVTGHPEELTRAAIKNRLEGFHKRLKRTTTRDDLDRLLLSVERREFRSDKGGTWEEVTFKDGKGNIDFSSSFSYYFETWIVTKFQEKILERNPDLKRKKLERSKLKREEGEWILDPTLEKKKISAGGEAIILNETFGNLDVAVRVQCFDPALFTEEIPAASDTELFIKNSDKLHFEIHLSGDCEVAENKDENDSAIPFHKNVIKNFSNIEIFLKEDKEKQDCLGWITVMEKCDGDLRTRLRKNDLEIEERKEIAIGVMEGLEYLLTVGIRHLDAKPENVLLKKGDSGIVPVLTDFGIIQVKSKSEKYRQMGYRRRGDRFKLATYIEAGTAAFTQIQQLDRNVNDNGTPEFPVHIWTLCDWKTAWSLLFMPIETDEDRLKIEKKLKAEWLFSKEPSIEEIKKVSKIISLKKSKFAFALDSNLTKSKVLANWKGQYTKQMNQDFWHLTQNIVDQKDTNLCVPISVSTLIRWALKNVLGVDDKTMKNHFSIERVLTTITMIVYPRSLAGLTLNPKKEEQSFQYTEIETLLKRLKFKTYFHPTGWDMIDNYNESKADFDFELVLLHEYFKFDRPLTVTGAFIRPDGTVLLHQMLLDRVENYKYVLQNTLINNSGSKNFRNQLKIPLDRPYYGSPEMMVHYNALYNDYVICDDNGMVVAKLVNENYNAMMRGTWYLLPQAYSITFSYKPAMATAIQNLKAKGFEEEEVIDALRRYDVDGDEKRALEYFNRKSWEKYLKK